MTDLVLQRFHGGADSTLGLLFVDDAFFCFTCEDEYRIEKVQGETRIPAGRYEIRLRTTGGMHARYSVKFPFHRGMLHLQDVPCFTNIYIHIGNNDDDTEGCILVGLGAETDFSEGGIVRVSTKAYVALYQKIITAMDAGEEVYIEVKDEIIF